MYNNLNPITHLPTLIKKQQQYTEDLKRIDSLLTKSFQGYKFTKNDIKKLKLSRNRIENDLHNINCWIKNRS